jgi:hypothetical protein
MGLLGQKKQKKGAAPPDRPPERPARKKSADDGNTVQGYDLDQDLPEDAPLSVKLAQVMRTEPKRLKQLFVSWAESEEGDEINA